MSKVLVTGASGYIAAWAIKELLDQDYQVVGTVRSLQNKTKNDHIYNIVPDKKHLLTLVEAELTSAAGWEEACNGCDYVLHIASPFPSKAVDEKLLIQPAVQGTTHVFEAAVKAGVKKIVITSSVAAIYAGQLIPEGKIFNEENWSNTDSSTCPAYEKSKTLAEKQAWALYEKYKGKIEMVILNPGFVIGPTFNNAPFTSGDVLIKFMNNELPGIPKVQFACVDVRDVAKAHIKALQTDQLNGKRCILSAKSLWFEEIGNILKKEFNPKGYDIKVNPIGYCLLWIIQWFDLSVKMIMNYVEKKINLDNTRSLNLLQLEYIDVQKSIIDMGYSLIKNGYVKNKLSN